MHSPSLACRVFLIKKPYSSKRLVQKLVSRREAPSRTCSSNDSAARRSRSASRSAATGQRLHNPLATARAVRETGSDGECGPAMMIVPLSDHGREDEDEHEEMRQSCVVACGRTPHAVVQASIYRLSAWRPTTLSAGASRWQRRAGLAVLSWCAVWARLVCRGPGASAWARGVLLRRKVHVPKV